ncbi:FKBP-type peptidyl-prolyl cis-trans isomerase [Pontibacter sp. BT310]|jgi:FKBP-type peptidyl-prolyl cis-trans isomerase FklB|uniref:Peptidyl-prolyl cis-trans isomerase n=1 Tax=Pontibacter populi TaxID=890055 RepID=A0ABS6XBL0_9BACT|nr:MULTISPECIES: FKBP-type peptidyl-prolyl cis-trans isomerase [Pontibacter]MBJ6118010.1 FKBP-type peptidyl-prolyl cis-trans isomerase [Pontibacter sp. BT310]MBW3364863.1 FKBP-type peptidyl-prolyl cis-trans isomerase [Pontibacter populi]
MTLQEKISYIIGRDMAGNLKKQGIDVNPDAFIKGMKEAIEGKPSALSQAEVQEAMMQLQQEMGAKQGAAGEENQKAGEAFLAENKNKEGVKTLPSGLQYEVLNEGTGKSPSASDKVTTHYHGTLIDGTVFDSSYERGQPATFPVNGVIAGWTEALQLMKEGAKWRLYIPSALAYGSQGAGDVIGPNAALIFDVELISVN